jgi:hypothetical protein
MIYYQKMVGVISDGFKTYVVRDGKKELIPPSSFAINSQRLFKYDQGSGQIKINRDFLPPGELEAIARLIEEGGEKGAVLDFPVPPFGEIVRVPGVRNVEYLSPEEIEVKKGEDTQGTYWRRGNLWTRIKRYFSR